MSLAEEFSEWYGNSAPHLMEMLKDPDKYLQEELPEVMRKVTGVTRQRGIGIMLDLSAKKGNLRSNLGIMVQYLGTAAEQPVAHLLTPNNTQGDKYKAVVPRMLLRYHRVCGADVVLQALYDEQWYGWGKKAKAIVSDELFELLQAYQGNVLAKIVAGLGIEMIANNNEAAREFFIKNKDHLRILQAFQAYARGGASTAAHLERALSVYYKLRDIKEIDDFIRIIQPNLPEEIREELDEREISSLLGSYEIIKEFYGTPGVMKKTVARYNRMRDASEEAFFSTLEIKVREGRDVREKKKILFEWSQEFQRLARKDPEKLWFEVGV